MTGQNVLFDELFRFSRNTINNGNNAHTPSLHSRSRQPLMVFIFNGKASMQWKQHLQWSQQRIKVTKYPGPSAPQKDFLGATKTRGVDLRPAK